MKYTWMKCHMNEITINLFSYEWNNYEWNNMNEIYMNEINMNEMFIPLLMLSFFYKKFTEQPNFYICYKGNKVV